MIIDISEPPNYCYFDEKPAAFSDRASFVLSLEREIDISQSAEIYKTKEGTLKPRWKPSRTEHVPVGQQAKQAPAHTTRTPDGCFGRSHHGRAEPAYPIRRGRLNL